jgi:DNA-binding Lrp family transcriptional regulator
MVGTVKACLAAAVKRGKEHYAFQKISKTKEVTEVLITYCLYYIVVCIEVQSLGQLDEIVTDIRQMVDIRQTSTLVGAY